jgi:DeoR/GlpR family transcriptional regulator of sugar metabolism
MEDNMLAIERMEKIKELILQNGKVYINELSKALNVSVVTIRKDIIKLEQEGCITRARGGAIVNNDLKSPENFRQFVSKEKALIGLIASKFIKEGDVIFLGPGSTCYNIARNIKNKKNITVITNNHFVIHELSFNTSIVLISTGGLIESNNHLISFTGDFTLEMLSNLLINTSFVTVDGLSIRNGCTLISSGQLELYNTLKKISNEIIIVSDKSKFDKTAMLHFCDLSELRHIVTENGIPDEYRFFFHKNNIQLLDSP